MRGGRFTEDQIIGVLCEHEAGVKTAELRRKHGISDATFYNWKAKYGGMTVSEAARLRTLEDENRRLDRFPISLHRIRRWRSSWHTPVASTGRGCGRWPPTGRG